MKRFMVFAGIVVVLSVLTRFLLPASFYTATAIYVIVGLCIAVLVRRRG